MIRRAGIWCRWCVRRARFYAAVGVAIMLAGIVSDNPWAVAHGFVLFLAAMICVALIWLEWL